MFITTTIFSFTQAKMKAMAFSISFFYRFWFMPIAILVAFQPITLSAQSYIECTGVVAAASLYCGDFRSEMEAFTQDGYTYSYIHVGANNAGAQSLPIINGDAYTGSGVSPFLAVHDANCNQVLGTFIGGDDDDIVTDIAVDTNGDIIVTGLTQSSDFITTDGTTPSDFKNIFIRKYGLDGTIAFSTLTADVGPNASATIILDGTDFYIIGNASAYLFSTTNGTSHTGLDDIIALKYDSSGNLIYSTIWGGSGNESNIQGVISNGNLVVASSTLSLDYPTTDGTSFAESQDVTLTILDALDNITSNTIYGGSGFDGSLL